jgi:hypothetical protein
MRTKLKNRLVLVTTTMGGAVMFLATEILAGQGPQPSICTRSCWGARSPQCSISQMSTLTRAIIHHTAGASDWTTDYETAKSKVRGAQNLHMDANGWCDIGYHFLVSAGGHIFEGRSGSMTGLPKGAHDGCNTDSFGFTLLGYYHSPYYQQPTSDSRDRLYKTIAWRMPSAWSPYGGSTYCSVSNVGRLAGHRNVKSTACPGSTMYDPYITGNLNGGEARDKVNNYKNSTSSTTNRKGIARTATGNGYWIVASDGGVFSFGDAAFYGSAANLGINNVVGIAARPQGDGYWLVGSDGGVFTFGAAPFHGSMGGTALNQPVVGIASTQSGNGYWLVAKDGGIFCFGDAPFHGSGGSYGLTDFVGMVTGWCAPRDRSTPTTLLITVEARLAAGWLEWCPMVETAVIGRRETTVTSIPMGVSAIKVAPTKPLSSASLAVLPIAVIGL